MTKWLRPDSILLDRSATGQFPFSSKIAPFSKPMVALGRGRL